MALLEGVRLATSNSPFTFPPRDLVTDADAFNATTSKAEYAIFVSGQRDFNVGLDIADPLLTFVWTRNDQISRFDWDGFNRRWNTKPGQGQEFVGNLSNNPRLSSPVPDTSIPASFAPYAIYAGSPTRIITFTVQTVATDAQFTDPASGTVQISLDKGELNFSTVDLNNPVLAGRDVYVARQTFLDRKQSIGQFGVLPFSSNLSYGIWLNPIPGTDQSPRIRIGYRLYLVPLVYAVETLMSAPPSGHVAYALDTGRVLFSAQDIDTYAGEPVYYDGVTLGRFSLLRTVLVTEGAIIPRWPDVAVSNPAFIGMDEFRYVFYSQKADLPRHFFQIKLSVTVPTSAPSIGTIIVDTTTGSVYVSSAESLSGYSLSFLNTVREVENGVSIQFYRSGANTSGLSQAPDFREMYRVQDQVIADSISTSPFLLLPTTPIQDPELEYKIAAGTSGGGFVGVLNDGRLPSIPGFAYFLDLDKHQFKFGNRKTVNVTLDRPSPSIKLADSLISPFGLSIKRNGIIIEPGQDFAFNMVAGLVDFLEPVGEGNEDNVLGIAGTVILPGTFIAPYGALPTGNIIGFSLFVSSGLNFGFHKIVSRQDDTVFVSPPFVQAGPQVADLRQTYEVLANRFWVPFLPPFKKIAVERSVSTQGPFGILEPTQFSVLATTGQVNLSAPLNPGEVVRVHYVSQDSSDDGVTVQEVSRVEFAGFKIRQEQATYVPNTGIVNFNPSGLTVLTDHTITLAIDGVTFDSTKLEFTAPGTILVPVRLTTESVVINYFVAEAKGGETSFNLVHTPIVVDFPSVTAATAQNPDPESIFNGDQTPYLKLGSPIQIDGSDIVVVFAATYDAITDQTRVHFLLPPIVGSTGAPLQVAGDILTGLITESAARDLVPQGTSAVRVVGDVASNYAPSTVVFLNDDAYSVLSASFDSASNRTTITLAVAAYNNYIIYTLRRTPTPIYLPSSVFRTRKSLDVDFPVTLVRTGEVNSILTSGIDYSVAEGGKITLHTTLKFGDELDIMYVARQTQPSGTKFVFNYAYQTSPSSSNRLLGQKLETSYDLYSPDTFYFRYAMVDDFVPELIAYMKSSSSSGSSGPSTSSVFSPQTQDFGTKSLYFDEQHYANLDFIVVQLLLNYNNVINAYEDILADLDGRAVGQSNGKFRFDGNRNNPPRLTYEAVTNDIDDRIKVRDDVGVVSFDPFITGQVPVFAPMWSDQIYSRFYSTQQISTSAAIAELDFQFGQTLGNLGITNITAVTDFIDTPQRARYRTLTYDGSLFTLEMIGTNGDKEKLIPPFITTGFTSTFNVWDGDGNLMSENCSVSEIIPGDPYFLRLTLNAGDNVLTFRRHGIGSISRLATKAGYTTSFNIYTDLNLKVDLETGTLYNNQRDSPYNPVTDLPQHGGILDTDVNYINQNLTPKRIPVLDGEVFSDSDSVSVRTSIGSSPIFTHQNEINLYQQETLIYQDYGTATVGMVKTEIRNATLIPAASQYVVFDTGPNAGYGGQVDVVVVGGFNLLTPLPFSDSAGTSLYHILVFGIGTSGIDTNRKLFYNLGYNNLEIGQKVTFITGPNATEIRTVDVRNASVSVAFPTTDLSGSNLIVALAKDGLFDILRDEIGVLDTNLEIPTTNQAILGQINSELTSARNLGSFLGTVSRTGFGDVDSETLTDASADFSALPPLANCFVLIKTGANFGVYRILSSTTTTLIVDTSFPYHGFDIEFGVEYFVVQLYSYFKYTNVDFLAEFIRNTKTILAATSLWVPTVDLSQVPSRLNIIGARTSYIRSIIPQIENILGDGGSLYNYRYLWIQQRIDKRNGLLTRTSQSETVRVTTTAQIIEDQKKLLVVSSM